MATPNVYVSYNYKSPLLGMGIVAGTGQPTNNKVLLSGRIKVIDYTTAGEPLTAMDIGLQNIDSIYFNPVSFADAGTKYLVAAPIAANYDYTNKLMIVTIDGGTTEATVGENVEVNFLAIGDSLAAPELT